MTPPIRDGQRPCIATGELPFLTADVPGLGGRLKDRPQDFVVEEIPAYEPCGTGEHLFLRIEKEDVAAETLISHVARRLGVSARDVGTAGMKDRRAVTRQYVSVPARCEAAIGQVATENIRVLDARRHVNKLRTGHLRGNRFSIVVRGVETDAIANATNVAERLCRLGCPNYFGDQRFGRDQETLRAGLELLVGRSRPDSISPSRRRFFLRLALSAVQSALFNHVLADRLRDGLLHAVLPGDVMEVAASGGKFVVADADSEQRRFDGRETVLTGPIFGPTMLEPAYEPAIRERRVLDTWGLSLTDFTRFPKLTRGTRRSLLVWPEELRVESAEEGVRLEFRLPSGAYATTVLRELMK